jgi:hypothetical protein
MHDAQPHATAPSQTQRWRSPLAIATVAGLFIALLTGSVLLFFILTPATRDYWILVHWSLAALLLPPYAVYQLRHYLRVRAYVRQTHYRVGLQAFFLLCGAVLSGLALVLPLRSGGTAYSAVNLGHIFFSYAFTLLVSAHLTLVALRTAAQAQAGETEQARSAIRRLFATAAAIGMLTLLAAIWLR